MTIYDKQMNHLVDLENATAINIDTPRNELWTAGFTLPLDDPKVKYCKPFYRVRLYDNDEEIGLFRIMKNKITKKDGKKTWEFKLEHVLGTLIDYAIPGYWQVDNTEVSWVILGLLLYQKQQDWEMGQVDFNYKFSYKFENVNGVYNALMSLTKPFPEPYQWTWDTSTYPWKLNLVRPSDMPKARIRAGYNMKGITKSEDPTKVITRIKGKGYGEGVNQLETDWYEAEPHLIDKYGIIEHIEVDRSIEDQESLDAITKAMLNDYKIPPVTYEIDAAEVHQITGLPIDRFSVGDIVRVTDDDLGEEFDARVESVSKKDVKGNPGDVGLELNRKVRDIADSQKETRERQRIEETYAQGATNIDSSDFADNCDAEHPAILRLYIPEETVKINKMRLSYKTENYRGYTKGNESGGAITVTSESGGASTQTSSSGGGTSKSTASGGATTQTSDYYCGDENFCAAFTGESDGGPNHVHVLPNQLLTHVHEVVIPSHKHSFSTPDHTHTVRIPSHKHEVNIPSHTHDPIFGIFEGDKARSVTVEVDGNKIPNLSTDEKDVDLTDYLSKDASGKIKRGEWHEIKITPSGNARIVANVFHQFFIQSRGGGSY